MENVILTPHIAGWTVEPHQKLTDTIASKIIERFGPEASGGNFFPDERI